MLFHHARREFKCFAAQCNPNLVGAVSRAEVVLVDNTFMIRRDRRESFQDTGSRGGESTTKTLTAVTKPVMNADWEIRLKDIEQGRNQEL